MCRWLEDEFAPTVVPQMAWARWSRSCFSAASVSFDVTANSTRLAPLTALASVVCSEPDSFIAGGGFHAQARILDGLHMLEAGDQRDMAAGSGTHAVIEMADSVDSHGCDQEGRGRRLFMITFEEVACVDVGPPCGHTSR